MPDRPGPTGKYPDGKIGPTDKGELHIAIGRDDNNQIIVDFGTDVTWLALDPQMARDIAWALLNFAGEIANEEIPQ